MLRDHTPSRCHSATSLNEPFASALSSRRKAGKHVVMATGVKQAGNWRAAVLSDAPPPADAGLSPDEPEVAAAEEPEVIAAEEPAVAEPAPEEIARNDLAAGEPSITSIAGE